jgi:hypothetical protein
MRFFFERERHGTKIGIADLITITSSNEEAQAATVKEYFSQTWPSAGTEILNILEVLLESRNERICSGNAVQNLSFPSAFH